METIDISALPEELRQAITRLSALSGKPFTSIAEEALRDYVGWRVPQLLDLEQAVQAADEGDFASDEEVERFFKRHGA